MSRLFFWAFGVVAVLVKDEVSYFAFFVFDEFEFGVEILGEEHGFGFGIDFQIALTGGSGNQLIAFQADVQ